MKMGTNTGFNRFDIPPMNYSQMAPGIYRSGYPVNRNFSFLKRLGLKSIV